MLKHELTYEDFNGNKVTETLYFHLSVPELIDMEVEHKAGLAVVVQNMIDAKDHRTLINLFKEVVLLSYGKKSDDGRVFEKSEEDKKRFSQSAAYHKMYVDLATDSEFGAKFINGIMPKEMTEAVLKAETANSLGVVPNS